MLKKIYFFAFCFLTITVIKAQAPLVLKFFVSDASNPKIRLNTQGAYSYSYVKSNNSAITGNGTTITDLTEISVPSIGTYTISIIPTGIFRLKSGTDADKVVELTQWGQITWDNNLSGMFSGYANIQITATDIPDFSGVTNLSSFFSGCTNLSIVNNINNWNVSNVTNMSSLFLNAKAFNKPIGNWNTSNVTNMSEMFYYADVFNQDIANWNVSNVTNMSFMFNRAKAFNQNINNWNVSNVQNMSAMFEASQSFNQPLNNWNTSNVTNMSQMFSYPSFNQDISSWDVSNVTNMSYMFWSNSNFNKNLGNWTLSPIVNLTEIFGSSGLDCGNYGATLKGWAENPDSPLGRLVGAVGRTYGNGGQIFRNQLINNKGWTFTGDNYSPNCPEPFLSVEEIISGKTKMTVYPNPASEKIFVKSEYSIKWLQVLDISGKTLIKVDQTNQIDVQQLPNGIYFIKISTADGSESIHKLIKK
ncbi:BspA family leucine-rich repeat surface protein [Chryseobacterium gregarium]|uniref:BspA family leucine-rich repeat surface protein n=1 Tax=Chryseobacterium gregarium TaxID=456299 RepID=UPI0004083A94|nr:BspA family leucine-rich repeat surface protein [Chryseobacterium gregarium]